MHQLYVPKPRFNPCLKAFLLALLTASLIFIPVMIWDKGYFFFFGDFNVQQIPFYKLAHEAIRSGDIRWNWFTRPGGQLYWLLQLLSHWQPFLLADPSLPHRICAPSHGPSADSETRLRRSHQLPVSETVCQKP